MSYSENNSYEKIMDRALSNSLLENVDKRIGSIIYDALAPMAMELANAYVKMDILEEQTYLMSATGDNLDKRVFDYGNKRKQATQALRIGEFKCYKKTESGAVDKDEFGNPILIDMDIPIGTRFAVPSDTVETTFKYLGLIDENKILECEQAGTKGNEHTGTILPLVSVNGLVEANIISTYQPAQDRETDEELRQRTKELLNNVAFGGNISDYIQKVGSIEGVGNTKVFPAWQYNGSVLLSVVDPQFNPITDEFAKLIKEEIDPEETTGEGLGIAPIGHYVTITTPVKENVKIKLTVELEKDVLVGNVQEEIEEKIEEYFLSVRKNFGQDKTLAIYRARIIDAVLDVKQVLNVTNVLLNDSDSDIVYTDEGLLGRQYLPYVQEVIID